MFPPILKFTFVLSVNLFTSGLYNVLIQHKAANRLPKINTLPIWCSAAESAYIYIWNELFTEEVDNRTTSWLRAADSSEIPTQPQENILIYYWVVRYEPGCPHQGFCCCRVAQHRRLRQSVGVDAVKYTFLVFVCLDVQKRHTLLLNTPSTDTDTNTQTHAHNYLVLRIPKPRFAANKNSIECVRVASREVKLRRSHSYTHRSTVLLCTHDMDNRIGGG